MTGTGSDGGAPMDGRLPASATPPIPPSTTPKHPAPHRRRPAGRIPAVVGARLIKEGIA